jgi:MFS transporter, DHA1 family, multidrug resistance protein
VFVALAAMNMTMLFGVIVLVDESPPEDRRRPGGLKTLPASMRDMQCNRHNAGYVMTVACTTSAMFGYTSASPFVLLNIIVAARTPVIGACSLAAAADSAIATPAVNESHCP